VASKKTIEVRLLGDPKGFLYNLGTKENPDWRAGGDVLDLDPDEAKRFVDNGMARYVDESLNVSPAKAAEPIHQAESATFDQTPPADNEEQTENE
jgi:hypothetical protein